MTDILVPVADLQQATAALNAVAAQVTGNYQAMGQWTTATTDTITFKDANGQDVTVHTLHYLLNQFSILETDVRSLLGEARAPQLSDYYRERDLMLAQVAASGVLVREVNRAWGTGTIANVVTMPDAPEFVLAGLSMAVRNEFRFPAPPDGLDTYNTSTGERLRHSSADAAFDAEAVGGGAVEVVRRRKDVFATEVWLELITPSHPHIFPEGDIHSTASTMDGFATEQSSRPDSYHAMYDGEVLPAKPKGVNLFAIPAAQLVVHLQTKANRLYQLNDYTFAQVRRRNRSIAGAGNGDWQLVSTALASGNQTLSFSEGSPAVRVKPQGALDAVTSLAGYTDGTIGDYMSSSSAAVEVPDVGVWKVRADSTTRQALYGVSGECFIIIHGEWARLNSGHYHPSHNDWGTAIPHINNDPAQGGVLWHDSRANHLDSVRACFTALKRYDGSQGGGTGHPSGRFSDLHYPGGEGGIIDRRLSAYRTTQADHAREDAKVKSGVYRGLETVKRCRVMESAASVVYYHSGTSPHYKITGWNNNPVGAGTTASGRFTGWVGLSGQVFPVDDAYISSSTNDWVVVSSAADAAGVNTGAGAQFLVLMEDTNLSVSGEFTWQTVIGIPADLAACPDTKDGWPGDWCPVIPDGTDKAFPSPRPWLTILGREVSDDQGASWLHLSDLSGQGGGDATKWLLADSPAPQGRIVINHYTVWADMTEPCANGVVRDGEAGLAGVVHYTNSAYPHYGGTLLASLLGKVGASTATRYSVNARLESFTLNGNDGTLLKSANYEPTHSVVSLGGGASSPAVKSLRYAIEDGGQANNCYSFAELGYSGDWGDAGKLPPLDNDATWVDDNGITRKAGTHKLSLPFGWT